MLEENIAVYETLRESIIHLEDCIQTAYINMFTVYFALLTLGFAVNAHLILISFFVLIVFQNTINTNNLYIQRISSYIRIFFENKRSDMHWELLNKDAEHIKVFHEQYRNMGWYIKTWEASVLSFISLILLAISIFQVYGMESLPVKAWMELFFAFFLFIVTIYINSGYSRNADIRKKINELDESIGKFCKQYYKKQNKITLEMVRASKRK